MILAHIVGLLATIVAPDRPSRYSRNAYRRDFQIPVLLHNENILTK